MNRREVLKFLGLGALIPIASLAPKSEAAKFVRKGKPGDIKFRVGDIVQYSKIVKCSWGANEEESYKYEIRRNTEYLGNKGIVVKAEKRQYGGSYAVDAIDKLPKHAWYSDEELELIGAVEERYVYT